MKTFLKVLVGLLLAGGLFMFAFYRTPKEKTFTKNLKLAQAGDMDAALALAEAYMKGEGTKPDTQEALKWYRWAAAADKPQASWELYKFYEKQGVLDGPLEEEPKEPQRYYRRESTEAGFGIAVPQEGPATGMQLARLQAMESIRRKQGAARNSNARASKQQRIFQPQQAPKPQRTSRPKKASQRNSAENARQNTKEKRELALAYLQRAADANFAPAQEEMGNLYSRGRAVPQHVGQSLFWYIKSAKNGSTSAQSKVDDINTKQSALVVDMEHFLQASELAQKEDQAAMLEVAQAYRRGYPILKNEAQALEWYQKVWDKSDHKSSQAAWELSDMYYKGEGTEANEQKGAEFLAAAAELKDSQAQYLLGEYAYTDDPARMEDAFAWFSNAAAQGHVKAQYMTGFMLFQGQGTAKSVPLAIRFFEQAAEQNDPSAQYVLGQIYLKGLGVRRNPTQGRTWLERAVENGSEPAKELLGV